MDENEKQIVLARMKRMPGNIKVAVGNGKVLEKKDMIDEVTRETALGESLVEVFMEDIRSFKEV